MSPCVDLQVREIDVRDVNGREVDIGDVNGREMDVRYINGRECDAGEAEGGHEADVPKGDNSQEDGDDNERRQKLGEKELSMLRVHFCCYYYCHYCRYYY